MTESFPLQLQIESALGRSVNPSERGSVKGFYDFPAELLAELRRIAFDHGMSTIKYLEYLIGHEVDSETLIDFRNVVLRQAREPATWRVQPVLCYLDLTAEETVYIDEATLLAPIEVIDGERWHRRMPLLEAWGTSAGAPGIVVASADFYFCAPNAFRSFPLEEGVRLELIADVEIAVRRHLASRLAFRLAATKRRSLAELTLDEACWELGLRRADLSPCGRSALLGVLREFAELGTIEESQSAFPADLSRRMPGFRGPDSWYQDTRIGTGS